MTVVASAPRSQDEGTLLSMAEYFELIIATLRRFGEFLIGLARQGYGSEFTVP